MAVRIILMSRRISGCKPFHSWNDFHTLSVRRLHTTIRGSSIEISPEVKSALNSGHPVVALESTILTHGLTYPENIETAKKVEDVVRKNGAVPATVGILKGKLCVGLSMEQVEFLSNQKSNAVKTSRRDLAYVISQGFNGGTTVSATMVAAHMAGIEIFVTGGIGGVHRGAEESMDVSADLRELGRTPVAVVCAGVKSILDIGKTLEYLETEGVCIATYGRSSEFPAFFSSKSGSHSPYQVDTPEVAAHLINTHMGLNLNTGMIVAVPIPGKDAVDNLLVEEAVNIALKNARRAGVNGKSITPFLLKQVNDLLGGVTQTANISLIQNNAIIGSRIACALSLLKNSGSNRQPSSPNPTKIREFESQREGRQKELTTTSSNITKTRKTENHLVVVVGGVNYDLTSVFSIDDNMVKANGSTYPGHLRQSFGGVGRNLSDCLSRLDVPSLFISAIGNDSIGDMFRRKYNHMDLSGVETVRGYPTASYSAVLYSSGELMFGTGDFEIHADISPELISRYEDQIRGARLVCMDGNIPPTSMAFITDFCSKHNIPVWFEPTDRHHVRKLFMSDAWKHVTYTSPNLSELEQLVVHTRQMPDCRQTPIQRETVHRLESVPIQSADGNICTSLDVGTSLDVMLDGCVQMCTLITNFIPNVLVTLGKHGVLWTTKNKPRSDGACAGDFTVVHYTANWIGHPDLKFCSVSGAGDCLAASVIAGLIDGVPADEAIDRGFLAAMLSLQSYEAVPDTISHDAFDPDNIRQRIHVNRTVLVAGQRPTSSMN